MIGMLPVVRRAKDGAELAASVGMDTAQEFCFVAAPVPAFEHGYSPAILHHEGKDIDRIGKGVLRQIAISVYAAATIGARCFDARQLRSQIFACSGANDIARPTGEATRKRASHRAEVGGWRSEIEQFDRIHRLAAATILAIGQCGKTNLRLTEAAEAHPRIGC